jgi:GxxExxY protein
MDIESLAHETIDCAYKVHFEIGPGLFEIVYEAVLAKRLADKGLRVQRQIPISVTFDGMVFEEGFKADLLIEEKLLVELKSVEKLAIVHGKQVLTYLRLLKLPLGILFNFGAATFREGVRRVVNNHTEIASSPLRLHR